MLRSTTGELSATDGGSDRAGDRTTSTARRVPHDEWGDAMTSAGLLVVDPSVQKVSTPLPLVERPGTPDGMLVGLREFWFNYDRFTRAFETLLRSRYDIPAVQRVDGTHPRTGRVLEAWLQFNRSVDWALVGFGACGGCAPWAVMDAVELENNGVPTVTLISVDLEGVARRTAESMGYPQLRILTLPHHVDDMGDEEIDALAAGKFDVIVEALTRPFDG
jgi:hypothetical protein